MTTNAYIGPWVWETHTDDGPHWRPPKGTVGSIDLRPWDACATPVVPSGYGLFVTDRTLDSPYYLLASDLDESLKPAAKSALVDALGLPKLSASTFRNGIIEIGLQRSDPDQGRMTGPLVPRHDRMWDDILHPWGRIYEHRFSGTGDVGWPTLQARLQRDYRQQHDFCHLAAGKANAASELQPPDAKTDAVGYMVWRQVTALKAASVLDWGTARAKVSADYLALYLKKLKYDSDKLGVDPRLLVPADLPYEGTKRRDTEYSDDFNRAALGVNWTAVDGEWGIVANTEIGRTSWGTFPTVARYEQDLSSDDHESEITDTFGVNNAFMTPAVRFAADAKTLYYAMRRSNVTTGDRINKVITGTDTMLWSQAAVATEPLEQYLSVVGATLTMKVDGVVVHELVDNTLSGQTRCGAAAHSSDESHGDDWRCADLGAAPAGAARRLVGGGLAHSSPLLGGLV